MIKTLEKEKITLTVDALTIYLFLLTFFLMLTGVATLYFSLPSADGSSGVQIPFCIEIVAATTCSSIGTVILNSFLLFSNRQERD